MLTTTVSKPYDVLAIGQERKKAPAQFDKAQRTGFPVYLRKEQRAGWTAELPIYVLWCAECSRYTLTYPAGYGRIHCACCLQYHRVMTWQRLRDKILKPLRFYGLLAAMVALLAMAVMKGVALLAAAII